MGESRRCAEARETIAAAGERLELREVGGAGYADLILPMLLRPVERRVCDADQPVPLTTVLRERRDAGAHGDRADVSEAPARDPPDDRLSGLEGRRLVRPGEEECELVTAEPERLASLAQPGRDLREHAVARGVPVLVVDPLEVVDVE